MRSGMSFKKWAPEPKSAGSDQLHKDGGEVLLKLETLRDLPKSKYATQACITGIPSGRGRKVIYSHIEVCKMVENIATQMREAGVRPQTPCAFILHNSVEAIVFFQALQWIGAIAVPIDPTLSANDIASFLGEVGTSIVVSSLVDQDDQEEDELFQKIRDVCSTKNYIQWYITRSTNQGVYLEMEGRRAGEGAAWAGGAGDFKYDPTETCFRMAHGEAGHCLSVEMSHLAATEAIRDFSKTYRLTTKQATLLATPFYSIHGLMCVLATMYSGGNVVVVEGSATKPESLLTHSQEQKVNWLSAEKDTVLSIYEIAKDNPSLNGKLNLEFIRFFGGNIDAQTQHDVSSVLGAEVLEAYGTPETCGLVSSNRGHDNRFGTCGKVIGECEIVIFDMNGEERLSAGTVGRIGVHGRRVSKRYLNSEYANKKSYIDVVSEGNEKTFFLTGDVGSLSEDGYLTVLTHGEAKKRAAALFREEEYEIQNQQESMRAFQLEQERLAKEEEERLAKEEEDRLAKVEEERLANEEEDRRKKEEEEEAKRMKEVEEAEKRKKEEEEQNQRQMEVEARKLEEEQKAKEEEKRVEDATCEEGESVERDTDDLNETSESSQETSSDEFKGMVDSDESEVPDEVTVNVVKTISAPAPETNVERTELDDSVIEQIMERLDQIEQNQRRLEEEIDGKHRLEMEKMRELIEKYQEANEQKMAPAPAVNMDEINSAVNKAAASAESSSRDTAAAAQAAKDAAAAAAAAAAAHKANESNMVEVPDPDAVQKTVMVSLEQVEQAIRVHPAIQTARAFGRPDPKYGVEVFCAVNPKKGARLSEPWLKLHAQSLLPAPFVPKKFFYKEGLRNEDDRTELSKDDKLKRISEISGYSSSKVIQSPSWSPQQILS